VLRPDNSVLLIRHTYRPGWHFPGGGVEKKESVLTALTRELDEEAGIKIDGKPELFGIYCHTPVYPGDHVVLFVVRSWTQTRVPPANYEIAEQGFFQADALPEGTHASTRARVAEVLHKTPRSDVW
jgi:8-oxo-dGTP pyrophosphatase MutT (NUDIX family)